MMKNIKNKLLDISALTLFFTIYGTFILFMYANVHKISFYDIFSSQMFIAIGIASLAMTLLSIAYFVIFTYITKLMLDYLFGKELFTININYFLYLTFSFLLSLVFFRFSLDIYEWYIPLSIAWISFIPLSVIVSFKINENGFFCLFLKTLALFSFGFGFFAIAGFI
ncbi:TPA: hypothetical protein QIS90_004038, partial [Providencia rettgeri]|nr:hypothetical protein [Providencia rettgeri]